MNPAKPYVDSVTPLAIAHRGFSPQGLENSLSAFKSALELGCTYLETDINSTVDGVAMVIHDPSLGRTTDRSGLLAELPYSVVQGAKIGGRELISTLREVVEALPEARFNIDVKDAGSVVPLAELIEELGLHDRICVASFSEKRRRAVLSKLSQPVASSAGMSLLAAYFLLSPWLPGSLTRAMMRGVDVLQIPRRHWNLNLVSHKSVARAHRLGLKIHVWTINVPAEMNELLDLGVDGIMTDRADILAEVMKARGYWN